MYYWPWLPQSMATLKLCAKSKPMITEYNRLLHTMNLSSNSYEPNITEHMAIPRGHKFDPSAELTFALAVVSVFVLMLNSL